VCIYIYIFIYIYLYIWATDWTAEVRFLARAEDFYFLHSIQTVSGADPVSFPVVTRGSLPGGKAIGEWSYTTTPAYVFMA
jgi:hypothetical protein